MYIAINYANKFYKNAQKLNSKTALLHGADRVIEYSPSDIDESFYQRNKDILDKERGNGYWLWKPYCIKKTLEIIEKGDYLIYADSGAYYINNITYLITCMEDEHEDIMVFTLPNKNLERIWSKRDAFILMECDCAKYADTPQRLAGFLIVKKTQYTCTFISEWLDYAQDARIITDRANCLGKDNYPEFRENRHDQTILSLLSKRYGIREYRDPSRSISDNSENVLKRSRYPQIFDLHRWSDVLSVEDVRNRREKQAGKILEYWETDKKIVLYGAGKNARNLIIYLNEVGLSIAACIISDDQKKNNEELLGVKVYYFSEFPMQCRQVKILVTTNALEIILMLTKRKYSFEIIESETLKAINTLVQLSQYQGMSDTKKYRNGEKMIKVSVIIPVYNRDKCIAECLDNILSQTLKEIEIICVDDESVDDTYKILMSYKERYNNILVVRQTHQGSGSARNLGMKYATGKYVCFMDSDDCYASNQVLEQLYTKAEKNDVQICGGNLITINESGEIRGKGLWFEGNKKVLFKEYGNFYGYTSFIFSLEMLRDNNITFPPYRRFQDPPFLMKAMVCAQYFYAVTETVYVYRIGYKKLKYSLDMVIDILRGIIDCFDIAQKANLVKTYNDFLKYILKSHAEYIYLYRDRKEIWELVNKINKISFNWMGEISEIFLDREHLETYVIEQKKRLEKMLCKCQKEKEVVIYGAGVVGRYFLHRYGNECEHIAGFAVSSMGKEKYIEGYEVKSIVDYDRKSLVIVAVGRKYADEILKYLETLQFENICYIEYTDFMMLDKIKEIEIV